MLKPVHDVGPMPAPHPESSAPGGTTRRQLLLAGTALGLGAWAGPAQATVTLEAYASTTSCKRGSVLRFFARDPIGDPERETSFPLTIRKVGLPDELKFSATVGLRRLSVPANAYEVGCGWPACLSLKIPSSWDSGLYVARFGSNGREAEVPFVVRSSSPGVRTRILVQVPFTTIQAYNPYGGKSLYDYNSSGNQRASKVSFDRPLTQTIYDGADPWQAVLVRWLAKNGYVVDFCSSLDLHKEVPLLDNYQLFITAGHDEYWTREMRERLDSFRSRGGNVVVLGGNTCWFQARLEHSASSKGLRTLTCYKTRDSDPIQNEALKTVTWVELVPPWPENSTIGLSSVYGAIWANGLPRPATPYIVQQPEHWIFESTGLGQFEFFGETQVGYETDAADLEIGPDGRARPTYLDGTPANLRVLAVADARQWASLAAAQGTDAKSGCAVISLHTDGGAVFNAGSTDWVLGLLRELNGLSPSPISQITRNVVNRLRDRYIGPP